MNTVLIALDRIDANPWQPRTTEDPEHILKIAESIAANGLMQPPAGRVVTVPGGRPVDLIGAVSQADWDSRHEDSYRVQIAFGHSRLAAYRLLHKIESKLRAGQPVGAEFVPDQYDLLLALTDKAIEANKTFDRIPVSLMNMTDEQMFAQGVQENTARNDLTAFEVAHAMRRYRDEFSKNSKQIGDLFGLSDSTVRGKLRLLDLPEEIQAQAVELPEGVIRELVSLYSLPDEVKYAKSQYSNFDFAGIVQRGLKNTIPATEYAQHVSVFIGHRTGALDSAAWKHNQPLATDVPGVVRACNGCQFRIQREGKQLCAQKACFEAHAANYRADYLTQASLLSGIPVGDEKIQDQGWSKSFTQWQYSGDKAQFEQIKATRCSNLRLYFDIDGDRRDHRFDQVEGFPKAQIVCQKRNGFCTCENALKTRGVDGHIKDAATFSPADVSSAAQAQGVSTETELTEGRLKEIAQETRRQKRRNLEVVGNMRDAAIMALAANTDTVEFWQVLAKKLSWGIEKEAKEAKTMGAIKALVIGWILDNEVCDPKGNNAMDNPERCEDQYNRFLKRFHRSLPFSIQGPAAEEARPAPKTLIEVLGGDS